MSMIATMFSLSVVIMMVTPGICIICKISRKQGIDCFIRAAGHAAIKPDSRLIQSCPGASSDSAADQCIHLQAAQYLRQRTVAVPVCIHHL